MKAIPQAACVFLHEQLAGGHNRIVALLRAKPENPLPFDAVVIDATGSGPPQVLHRTLQMAGRFVFQSPTISQPDLTIFAAQLDPDDSSHFEFDFLYGQSRGRVDGHLMADGRTVRILPAAGAIMR